jgi:hypothetical protein
MKLKTIQFEVPAIPAIAKYKTSLGIQDDPNTPGEYERSYDAKFGSESTVYPIFTADGKVEIKVNPKQYTRIIEYVGGSEPSYQSFFNGFYKEVRSARVGFEVTVLDKRVPLRLLFEKIMDLQGSTVFKNGNWSTLKCWDSVGIEPDNYEDDSLVTERDGVIAFVNGSDGDGIFVNDTFKLCDPGNPDSERLYGGGGFRLRFLEAAPRLLR